RIAPERFGPDRGGGAQGHLRPRVGAARDRLGAGRGGHAAARRQPGPAALAVLDALRDALAARARRPGPRTRRQVAPDARPLARDAATPPPARGPSTRGVPLDAAA